MNEDEVHYIDEQGRMRRAWSTIPSTMFQEMLSAVCDGIFVLAKERRPGYGTGDAEGACDVLEESKLVPAY